MARRTIHGLPGPEIEAARERMREGNRERYRALKRCACPSPRPGRVYLGRTTCARCARLIPPERLNGGPQARQGR